MSNADKEVYVKEESFGIIDCRFFDFKIESELEDARIVASPQKLVAVSPEDAEKAVYSIHSASRGMREIIRDLSRYIEITFTDVYALNTSEEGWEDWEWSTAERPTLNTEMFLGGIYPILKIENSAWRERIFPEWNRDWMDQTTHWRLISLTNSIDILARSAKGEWRKGS